MPEPKARVVNLQSVMRHTSYLCYKGVTILGKTRADLGLPWVKRRMYPILGN